ncbi:helix-turn-helix transcriptional regulator [Anabaena sp. UHCC 0399]|uniref:helix-turn-helix domain-containing protein n=1 Tax=Anabaena sp. UHCC 0399 TaxID=3110238 RepID=UPI002B218F71|nr:helix-turn-helix transcriptional regulator [Anabaena sp. UHCC 0399]MEA5569149.1 helix-turn-helix transcriptional regulator [Anabaena sp. UHCC 0399]
MPQIHQLFKQSMDRYGVQGKELAVLAGISPNHLSEFRNGKKWVSPEVLTALLEGMDKIAPGSRRYFCQLLAEEPLGESDKSGRLAQMIEAADDDEMEAAMIAIGRKWKRLRVGRIHTENVDQAIAV